MNCASVKFAGLVEASGQVPRYAPVGSDQAGFEALVVVAVRPGEPINAIVVAVDLGRGVSLTNCAREFCDYIRRNVLSVFEVEPERVRWIYRDTGGRWDEMLPRGDMGQVAFRAGSGLLWARNIVRAASENKAEIMRQFGALVDRAAAEGVA
jgi:hypothetical protein